MAKGQNSSQEFESLQLVSFHRSLISLGSARGDQIKIGGNEQILVLSLFSVKFCNFLFIVLIMTFLTLVPETMLNGLIQAADSNASKPFILSQNELFPDYIVSLNQVAKALEQL